MWGLQVSEHRFSIVKENIMLGYIFVILSLCFILLCGLLFSICLFIGAYRNNEPILYFLGVGVLLIICASVFCNLGI